MPGGLPRYERIEVDGRARLVCAECRVPLLTGHSPIYSVPQPGDPHPDAWGQALCGPCYLEQFKRVNPGFILPDIADGRIPRAEAVPFGQKQWDTSNFSELEYWQQAIDASRNSQGAESVEEAYRRLKGFNEPDVEMTAPPAVDEIEKPKRGRKQTVASASTTPTE